MARTIRLMVASTLSLFIVCCGAYADDYEEALSCGETQLEINECAHMLFKRADDELNSLYQTQLNKLETAATKAELREAQRAWIIYRDKTCRYEAGSPGGGSIRAQEHFHCMKRLTRQRVDILRRYVACTQNGCPR